MLDQPGVHTAISGAKTPAQIEANVRAAQAALSEDDLRLVDEVAPVEAAVP